MGIIVVAGMAENNPNARLEGEQTTDWLERLQRENAPERDVNIALAILSAETARAGNNCVVFIMWLLSRDFLSSSV